MYFNDLEEAERGRQGQEPDRLKSLHMRVAELMQSSQDADFTVYLKQLKARLDNQEQQIVFLTQELDRNVQLYENNMRMRMQRAQAAQVRPPQAAMAQQVQPDLRQAQPQAVVTEQTAQMQVSQQTQTDSQQAVMAEQMQPDSQQAVMTEQTQAETQQETIAEQAPQIQAQPQALMTEQTAQIPAAQVMIPGQTVQPQVQVPPQRIYVQEPKVREKKKHNAEYVIGVTVLSIVGAAFVLTAMVLLGMYFMEGLTKGLLLYAVCLAVMLLAELFLYRKWPGLGMTFSAIGMGGLYISTLINYLVLHNFHQWVALGLTLLITLVVLLLGRKRDAAAYRILGMTATYVCILLVPGSEVFGSGLSLTEFATAAVMALLVNIMCLAVPVRRAHTGIHVTHMALNTAFTFIAYFAWAVGPGKLIGMSNALWQQQVWQRPLFLAVSVLVMQLIFMVQVRWQERQTPNCPMGSNTGICVVYGFSIQIYMLLAFLATDFYSTVSWVELFEDAYLFNRLVCSAVAFVICLIPMIALRNRQEKWFVWYLLLCLTAAIHVGHGSDWETAIYLLVILVVSKLLSFSKRPMVWGSDAVVTALVCLYVVFGWEETYVIPLVIGLLLSVFCLHYWHVFFQTFITFSVAFYAANHMLSVLRLPVFVGIMFVGMLLFNNVRRWRGCEKGILGFNVFAVGAQAVAYLFLVNPVYQNAYLTYLCMLIFGVATFVVCFQKKYQLDLKYKQLLLMIFLTYMGLIVRTDYPIVNSILLMTVALIGVGMGFAIQRKGVRIYGLVLSLVICAKLVLYDFMGANVLQKTILFFVVGVLALMIATIYMLLEHNQEKRNQES